MEKVFHPCVLITKKRYVGHAFEAPGQAVPVFDAKALRLLLILIIAPTHLRSQGIEAIRRDQCGATQRIMEKAIRLLFSDPDLSRVKARRPSLPPSSLAGGGAGGGARINAAYYITKAIIPPLQRVFQLVGADLEAWYHAMPKPARAAARPILPHASSSSSSGSAGSLLAPGLPGAASSSTLEHYYLSRHCPVCDALAPAPGPAATRPGSSASTGSGSGLCAECAAQPAAAAYILLSRLREREAEGARLAAAGGAALAASRAALDALAGAPGPAGAPRPGGARDRAACSW
eukprot:tig00021038_g17511.t1